MRKFSMVANSGSRIVQYICVQLATPAHPVALDHTYKPTCTHAHIQKCTQKAKRVFLFCCHSPCLPPVVTAYPAGVLQSDQSFWNHKSPKIWSRKKNIKIKKSDKQKIWCRQRKVEKQNTRCKMQLMSRCSHTGKLSWVTSGQSEEVVSELPRIQQPKQVSRNMAASLWPLLTSVTPSTFRPQPIVLPSSTTPPFSSKCPFR